MYTQHTQQKRTYLVRPIGTLGPPLLALTRHIVKIHTAPLITHPHLMRLLAIRSGTVTVQSVGTFRVLTGGAGNAAIVGVVGGAPRFGAVVRGRVGIDGGGFGGTFSLQQLLSGVFGQGGCLGFVGCRRGFVVVLLCSIESLEFVEIDEVECRGVAHGVFKTVQ